MSCLCDEFRFPPPPSIVAGLGRLRRQLGTFGEFRRALLHAASVRDANALDTHPLWSPRYLTERDRDGIRASLRAIGQWRGRHPEDFGVMLLELWAYVCDLTSFYDEVLANEAYVGTARRRASLRKLVAPLGYVARPAVAALADLAAFADGRRAVTLPPGTAFRSGAFGSEPPQVFELPAEATIHPLLNEWTLLPVRPRDLPATSSAATSLLCKRGTVSVKTGDRVIVVAGGGPQPRRVASVTDITGADGEPYVRVTFDLPLAVPAGTHYSEVRLLRAGAVAAQWKSTTGETSIDSTSIYLDAVSRQIRSGDFVLLEGSGLQLARVVARNEDATRTVTGAGTVTFTQGSSSTNVSVPAVTARVSHVVFTSAIADLGSPHIDVYHAFTDGGSVVAEALTEIDRDNALAVRTPLERPRDAQPPGLFQLEDKNGLGVTRPGSLSFASGEVAISGDPWPQTLVTPVALHANIVTASRGETVAFEFLGAGDAAIVNQSFTLKKSPLTYLPAPSVQTPSGLTSTLVVHVDGVQWHEVPSFYDRHPNDEIYVVRQNDAGESIVTFGDGLRGRRLSTGVAVAAAYRHGGGGAMPPAGSITQIAKPVTGLKSVRSAVAPYGGADAEPPGSLRKFAPRSALLLGRAVSLADLEAAAASYIGIRSVAAEWRWSNTLQIPAAHIWYLADGDLTTLLRNKLRGLTQPDIPLQVERAMPQAAVLSIQIERDPRRFEADVLAAARAALNDLDAGLLPPERLGIAKPLFRSRIFELLLRVAGVTAITALRFDSSDFSDFSNYGVKPAPGHYFDFTNGLFLNGRNA